MALGVFGSLSRACTQTTGGDIVCFDNSTVRYIEYLSGKLNAKKKIISCYIAAAKMCDVCVCVLGLSWRMNAQYNAIVSTLSECGTRHKIQSISLACSTRWRRISRRFRAHNILTCTLQQLWAMSNDCDITNDVSRHEVTWREIERQRKETMVKRTS